MLVGFSIFNEQDRERTFSYLQVVCFQSAIFLTLYVAKKSKPRWVLLKLSRSLLSRSLLESWQIQISTNSSLACYESFIPDCLLCAIFSITPRVDNCRVDTEENKLDLKPPTHQPHNYF